MNDKITNLNKYAKVDQAAEKIINFTSIKYHSYVINLNTIYNKLGRNIKIY